MNEPSTRYGLPWKRFVKKIEPADNIKPTMKIIKSLLEGKDYPDQNSGLEITKSLVASIISSSENSRFVSMILLQNKKRKNIFGDDVKNKKNVMILIPARGGSKTVKKKTYFY